MGFLHVEQKRNCRRFRNKPRSRGNLIGKEGEFTTNQEKVFSCGDARRGQSLVVWAISEGLQCAEKVDAFLS